MTERLPTVDRSYGWPLRKWCLRQDIMYIVIDAKKIESGYILKGGSEVFSHLRHDLYDELELKPKSRAAHSLLNKLD